MKTYPPERLADKTKYVWSGEHREPKKGEFFLSGAQPVAYLAPNDLSTKYNIAVPYDKTIYKDVERALTLSVIEAINSSVQKDRRIGKGEVLRSLKGSISIIEKYFREDI